MDDLVADMSEDGKTGRRAFAVEDWVDYVRFKEKKYSSGTKFENPEEGILRTKGIEEIDEVYVIEYAGKGEKQIIESRVMFLDWSRAKAWADAHADGDDWQIASLAQIDRQMRV